MSWNYRVCKTLHNKGTSREEVELSIREVYYNRDGDIWAISEHAVGIIGEFMDDINDTIQLMKESVNKEVIDLDTLVFAQTLT